MLVHEYVGRRAKMLVTSILILALLLTLGGTILYDDYMTKEEAENGRSEREI